jgi:hypothetical protein
MHGNGRTTNRINLVFVGDGYTEADQATFDASAERAWLALTAYEPYKTYRHFFDAWRVNLVSPTAGISNDPTDGTPRATPLGMHFWCHGIDRLLCVDTTAASAYGDLFPGVSHVVALAHTTTYGGAGGSITTLAGENPDSDAVIVHEMAHTIGGLGDEYQSSLVPAPGPAASSANVESAEEEASMRAHRAKWYRWLGKPSADGGVVGAYEGANYYDKGFFRPSPDSEMRTLGRPFNPPSVEALIEAFYVSRTGRGSVDPIDAVTPVPGAHGVTDLTKPLQAKLVPLVGRDYEVHWTVNGVRMSRALGRTKFDLGKAPLEKGVWNRVTLWVVDDNPAVIDEDFRLRHMAKSRAWWVWGGRAAPAVTAPRSTPGSAPRAPSAPGR